MEQANFGDLLREGREKRGFTLDELARKTRVPEQALRALEAGQLEGLPPEVYTRGFIRSISRALEIADEEPLARYAQALADQRYAAAVAEGGPLHPDAVALSQTRLRRRRIAIVAAVAVAVALLLVWALFRRG